jgi:hypothetical protein
MRTLLSACVVLALALPAAGQPRYDRKLEDAVKAIVAARIGDIRGGFDLDERPVIVVVRENGMMGTTELASTRLAPLASDVRWTGAAPSSF